MDYLNNMKFGKKIGLGFALTTLILTCAVLFTLWGVRQTTQVTDRLIDLRVPTAQASLSMQNGMNQSLAALRGWMLLGKSQFKDERVDAWNKSIDPAFNQMKEFSKNWTQPENIERLNIIETNLDKFRGFQKEIETMSQTVENQPALHILFTQAAPQGKILAENITVIINIELKQPATPARKALLGMMADFRGTVGLGLAAVRGYLISGDEKFKGTFETLWTKNSRRYKDLASKRKLLTPAQKAAFDLLAEAHKIFDPLPQKMFAIRGGADWNLANSWLAEKAAPTAFIIKGELNAMIESQKRLMMDDIAESKSLINTLYTQEWALLFIGVILSTLIGFTITRSVTRPVKEMVRVADNLAKGKLNQSIDITSKDEIGLLAESLNVMITNLKQLIGDVSHNSTSTSETSLKLFSTVKEVNSSTELMSSQSVTIASATSQASLNMNTIASSAEEMSISVMTVSAAVEEMSATVNEIAQNCQKESEVARRADAKAQSTNEMMFKLESSSTEIGKVLDVIKDIADQTNLLALNATIEAASAGDAGKGFAVVASEVKELAKQTTQATAEIERQIGEMRANTSSSVIAIKEITAVIEEVNGISQTIVSAVEEQSATINEIAGSVSAVSNASTEVSLNVKESATGLGEISNNIGGFHQSINDITSRMQHVEKSTESLSGMAKDLSGSIETFEV
ncbi:MAG: methyl-accepting chemotaxis protein [Fibrobacterales bacterium]